MQRMISPGEIKIRHIAAVARRAPIATPVRTSFGIMRDRPAVFVQVVDDAGAEGVGEIWCNFPSVGAEHRARLAQEVVGPVLIGLGAIPTATVFARLMERLHVLALQSGEWGPLRQVAAGLDAACHDLAARRAGEPLWRFLNPDASPRIRAYASGIGPEDPAQTARDAAAAGHAAFKLKVGFGRDTDLRSLDAIRAAIGDQPLMIDANQGWSVDEAAARCDEYSAYDLTWIEEPLRADRPLAEWRRVAERSAAPLAAGENIATLDDFDVALAANILRYMQPDVAKWGGASGCLDVARRAQAAGCVYCPHYLGGGVGLLASAHLLAAAGGEGLLEIDVNPNPLRDELANRLLPLESGAIQLSDAPGIGVSFDACRG